MGKKKKNKNKENVLKKYHERNDGIIIEKEVGNLCRGYNQIFGANKNLYRVIPSLIDGLKPVTRRALYTIYKYMDNGFNKVANISGQTLRFHPHGQTAIEDAIAAKVPEWLNNAPIFDGKGNFGSHMGDSHGAGRYIEAKLSEYSKKCFFEDFGSCSVDMKMSYTGKDEEPEYLPAKYPHALIDGTLGIGYGMASNIPPFNLKEVLDMTIQLIKNPEFDGYLIPDSPSGCVVVDDGQYKEIFNTGLGKYTQMAKFDVDKINNVLVIRSLPQTVMSDKVVKKIVDIKMTKDKKGASKLDEIVDITNYSSEDSGTFIELKLSSTANPDDVIEKLLKMNIGLREGFPVNITLIDDYTDYSLSIRDFLLEWIEYRRDAKRSFYSHKLANAIEADHINSVLIMILNKDNAEKTLTMFKSANSKDDIVEPLMKEYGISSLQAKTIADMKMSAFTKDAYRSYLEKRDKLKTQISEYKDILKDNTKIDEIIIDELNEGIKLFGEPRRCEVFKAYKKKVIPDTTHILIITNDGYCKKLDRDTDYLGKTGTSSNGVVKALIVNNRDTVMVFDKGGEVSRFSVSEIPNMSPEDTGISLERYFSLKYEIISVMVDDFTSKKDAYFLLATKKGYIKRTPASEFKNIRDSKTCISCEDGDELIEVEPTINFKKDIIVFTNKGNGIRLNIESIKPYKRTARGLLYMSLADDEYVVGFDRIKPSKNILFYITAKGKVKITELKYFPEMKRKSENVTLINLDEDDSLLAVKSVSTSDTVRVVRMIKGTQDIKISELPLATRVAKATKLVAIPRGDSIAAVAVIE